MTDSSPDELAALRTLLAEALSEAPDPAVSRGAVDLRRQFSEAAMRRLDGEPNRRLSMRVAVVTAADKQRESE